VEVKAVPYGALPMCRKINIGVRQTGFSLLAENENHSDRECHTRSTLSRVQIYKSRPYFSGKQGLPPGNEML